MAHASDLIHHLDDALVLASHHVECGRSVGLEPHAGDECAAVFGVAALLGLRSLYVLIAKGIDAQHVMNA